MMKHTAKNWILISFLNLLIVAILGTILRYKIVFSLPFINQKYLLHAHSHFAFSGWITMALMTLTVDYLKKNQNSNAFKKYKSVLWLNLLTSYGMLFSFPFEGYATVSIIFSTLSIIVSYVFAMMYWKDLKLISIKNISHSYLKAALIFFVLSSTGVFALAYMMATKQVEQNYYLASVYFFLHFQYNGWFIFAIIGLWIESITTTLTIMPYLSKLFFWVLSFAVLPTYLLSTPWLSTNIIIHSIVIIAATLQFIVWTALLIITIRLHNAVKEPIYENRFVRKIYLLIALSFSIKLLLQLVSSSTYISNITYGFRPIVIGYLHLVFLGVVSLFILAYSFSKKIIPLTYTSKAAIIIFIVGILLNEILLMIQGIADLAYYVIPDINLLLLLAAFILLIGITFLNLSVKLKH
ncbi:hypothetical protein LX80_02264 [Hydrotalea sandarakina]|jgi:hypothetical protein|uniref:Uncharacterized protein n=1 Tax=Hydrotalea sandarakina TaxID=1004304 RepID=A0A2W7RMC5_9BACT|nr:hypothetical protein LX80_02264 [Hydrotalea sandarakina]